MSVETTLRLRNDFSELSALADATTNFLEENQTSLDVVFAANLAIEELVTNIIKYGYDDDAMHEISVHIAKNADTVHIRVCDDGHEFNPFDHPEPDTTLPVEQREIGGLGIHFVRNMLDSCDYRREGDTNIVTIIKKL